MGYEHQLSNQESTAEDVIPAAAKVQLVREDDGALPLPPSNPGEYAATTAKDKGRLQDIICSGERVTGSNLQSPQEQRASETLRRAVLRLWCIPPTFRQAFPAAPLRQWAAVHRFLSLCYWPYQRGKAPPGTLNSISNLCFSCFIISMYTWHKSVLHVCTHPCFQ